VSTGRSGLFQSRYGLADTIQWLTLARASSPPGWEDDVLLADGTPVKCARSREAVKRVGSSSLEDALGDASSRGNGAAEEEKPGTGSMALPSMLVVLATLCLKVGMWARPWYPFRLTRAAEVRTHIRG
jgi:hypothetical protein